jgi:hypothetical protein
MRRQLAAFVALLALGAGYVVAAGGRAGAATECRTAHAHWAVTEASVSVRIAWIDVDLEACTDGAHLRSTTASTDSGMTGPGIAAGFVFRLGSPHRTSFTDNGFGGGSARYAAKGSNMNCINHWVHILCSPTEDYEVIAKVRMASQVYAQPPGSNWWTINGRYFLFVFTARCTNSACDLHFHH